MVAESRVYRMRSWERIVSIVLLVFGLVSPLATWGGVLTGRQDARFLEMMFPIVFSMGAAFFTIGAFRKSVRLTDHRIEVRGVSGTRMLPLDKIKGRRRYFSPGPVDCPGEWHLVFEPNDDRYSKLDIEELYRFDDEFYEWFNALPDLDEIDKSKPKSSNLGLV